MTDLEKRLAKKLEAMHKIVSPGEYGIGNEPESIPWDDKKAWETLGEMIDEALWEIDYVLRERGELDD